MSGEDVGYRDSPSSNDFAWNADKEGGQHQQSRQIHGHNSLKKEGLEEVGCVDNDEDEDGGEVGGHDLVDDPSLEDDDHVDALGGHCYKENIY